MTMLAPFAAVESLVNASVEQMLSNATAQYQGGEPFGVIFDTEGAGMFQGDAVDLAACTAGFCIANTPGISQGADLVIGGVVYVVSGPVQPDAGGWVSLTVYPKD